MFCLFLAEKEMSVSDKNRSNFKSIDLHMGLQAYTRRRVQLGGTIWGHCVVWRQYGNSNSTHTKSTNDTHCAVLQTQTSSPPGCKLSFPHSTVNKQLCSSQC